MPSDYYPKREADIVTFTDNFSAIINAHYESFGFTAAQVSAYAAAQQAFEELYQQSMQPSTRTPSVIEAKRTAQRMLERLTRQFARLIRGRSDVSSMQRVELGLSVRDRGRPRGSGNVDSGSQMRRIGPPLLKAAFVRGRVVSVRLRDRWSPMNRGKPEGAEGATVLYHVGDAPPSDPSLWMFAMNTSKTVFDVVVQPSVPAGSKVWLTARWFNERMYCGPASQPEAVFVGEALAKAA